MIYFKLYEGSQSCYMKERKKERRRKKISLFGRVGTQHITRTVITKKKKQKKNNIKKTTI